MQEIIPKILTYIFVLLVYAFIYTIIRMIFLDIRTMSRKKDPTAVKCCIRLMNIKKGLKIPVADCYEIDDENIIGRSRRCTIRIKDDAISGVHCRIYKAEGTYFIEDMGSANGTLLNGENVADEVVELIDGDKISIGSLMFLFVNNDN